MKSVIVAPDRHIRTDQDRKNSNFPQLDQIERPMALPDILLPESVLAAAAKLCTDRKIDRCMCDALQDL
jgi:hypothetical protein